MENVPWDKIFNYLQKMGAAVTDKVVERTKVAYPIIIRQVYVDIAIHTIWFLLFAGFLLWVFTHTSEEGIKETEHEEFYFNIRFWPSLVAIPCAIYNFINAIIRLINPHWYAAQKIMELIDKSGK